MLLTLVLGAIGFLGVNLLALTTGKYDSNYMYTKLVMSFAPMFSAFFSVGLEQSTNKYKNLKTILAITVIITGTAIFWSKRQDYIGYVDVQSIQSIDSVFNGKNVVFLPQERGYAHGVIVGQKRYIDRTSEVFMNPLLHWKILDQWMVSTWSSGPQDAEIILLVKRDRLLSESAVLKKHGDRLVYTTRTYLLFDTHTTVKQLLAGKSISQLFIREP